MSPITVGFRHSALTYEPMQLSPPEIWAVARNVRAQLANDPLARTLDLSRVDEQGARLDVNDIRFGVIWDLDHDVRNEHDTEVHRLADRHNKTRVPSKERANNLGSIGGVAGSNRVWPHARVRPLECF
jgi:hypothetical protein